MDTRAIFLGNLTCCVSGLLILTIVGLVVILTVPAQYKKKVDFIEPMLFVLVYGFTYLTSSDVPGRKRLALLAAIVVPILAIGTEFFLFLK
jgi:hypothetical protein